MSATPSARRNFLRGRFQRLDDDAMRPPWAVAGMADLCSGCGDCARACPQAIIVPDDDRRPVVDFRRDACTFCRACADACETGALDPEQPLDWPWRATVSDACLSAQGVYCRACEDSCDPLAIRFRLQTGGRSFPVIDFGQCTGCGACSSICPSLAISFIRHQPEKDTVSA
ncbi:MAG: ferredoxin-type protein NapF [Paracoccus sp. (in: a-proteobacteria)]|uniref:ferredoxin-type protein NapF n=1 Tax=Paracoccus sp. TaxID=267 RepID=UPI0026DF3B60|nr:ferredoxin-type protein NapF [Paracoccus sp. (in: a-proteobacteria)]MDO5612177.1 ferredoxin-type protein NapF [Paracoccus sp. (in: a-proteobacteria)]